MLKKLKRIGRGQNRYSVYDNEGIKKQNYYVLANSHSAADYKVKQQFGEYAKAGWEISTKDWEWMTEDQEVIVQPSKVKQLFASSILLSIALVVSASLYNVFFK
jgi:hypothetical protein